MLYEKHLKQLQQPTNTIVTYQHTINDILERSFIEMSHFIFPDKIYLVLQNCACTVNA